MSNFNAQSVEERILSALRSAPGRVFSYSDLGDVGGSPSACRIALKRLCDSGRVLRLFSGLYQLANGSAPMPEAIASALARKFGWLIRQAKSASGDSVCYLSSGPYRSYDIAGMHLEFRHAASRRLASHPSEVREKLHRLSQRVKAHLPDGVLENIHHIIPLEYRERLKDNVEFLVSLGLMLASENPDDDAVSGTDRK